MVAKELERYDADSKQSTEDFEGAANITVDTASVITKEKQSGNKDNNKEDLQAIYYNEYEINKSKDKNEIDQKENASKQK